MTSPIASIGPVQLADVASTETMTPTEQPSEKMSTQANAHARLNAAIIQASIDVSINSHNEPLALLLKSAISGINELLQPEFGANAIQNAVSQDNTPEGTAGRIVAVSTGFFAAFKQQHAGEAETDVLKNFMTTIRGGFERGYKEASDILQGMGVLSRDIAEAIDKTYQLVQKGYADFEAAHGNNQADTPASSQS